MNKTLIAGGVAVLALVVAFVALVLLLLVGALVLGAALVALLGDLIAFDQFQLLQHFPGKALKRPLVVERIGQRVEIGIALDPLADQRQTGCGDRGRFLPGQPFAHHQAKRGRQRHFVTVARARDWIGAQADVERAFEVLGDAGIAKRAERLDPCSLDGIKHRTRHRIDRRRTIMQRDVVMLQPKCKACLLYTSDAADE